MNLYYVIGGLCLKKWELFIKNNNTPFFAILKMPSYTKEAHAFIFYNVTLHEVKNDTFYVIATKH